ncbi:EipB family protein [Bartonella sp. DGB2]|uniref:EipB family protein n=1 Tax=Bartonella sp. DGB2 TaxID=3388426 RepID=UPI00398FCCFA
MIARLIWAGAALFVSMVSVEGRPDEVHLAPHLARYDLNLETRGEKADLEALNGRMVFELRGDFCTGYVYKNRTVIRLKASDSVPVIKDQQWEVFETKKEFRFQNKIITSDDMAQEEVGRVTKERGGLVIALTKPEHKTFQLRIALFPVEQLKALIERARAGKPFYTGNLYDIAQAVDRTIPFMALIGQKQRPKADEETKIMGKLGQESYWPISIAYFNDKQKPDGLPLYREHFRLYDNGVVRDSVTEFDQYSIRYTLVAFELLPTTALSKSC